MKTLTLFLQNASNKAILSAPSTNYIKDTKLYTGTENLFNDLTGAITTISSIAIALLLAAFFFASAWSDEANLTQNKKRIKIAGICFIAILSVNVFIQAMMHYYG